MKIKFKNFSLHIYTGGNLKKQRKKAKELVKNIKDEYETEVFEADVQVSNVSDQTADGSRRATIVKCKKKK